MIETMKEKLAEYLSTPTQLDKKEIYPLLERPRDATHGDLAFPCFALSKKLRLGPPQIAKKLADDFASTLPKGFLRVQAVGGYLNFVFDPKIWSELVLSHIQNAKNNLGQGHSGDGKVAVFDYSSPNVAKPMSIGHLRSTVIGQALVNLFKTQGYKTVGINYLGDWGVQFGKLAWAHLNKAELLKIAKDRKADVIAKGFGVEVFDQVFSDSQTKPDQSFDYLYAIYVLFHAVSEVDDRLEAWGRDYFVKLENRTDPQVEKIWKTFVEISLVEYNRVYKLLNTTHDLIRGESYYENHLKGVVEDLKKKGLLKASEGAQIVDLEPFNMPPCLITKSDGATLYATRDIAAAVNRKTEFKADRLIYVVGAEQTLHFKQFFKVLDLMGHGWAKDCVHVPFGLYRFKEGKMSTRRGNVVFLEDVLDRAIELVEKIIAEKNPNLKNPHEVAMSVGTGAVIFNDLMNDRVKNIDFDWDRLLDFNGDTGPYVQYTHVRCCSVLQKWGKAIPKAIEATELKEKLELHLLQELGRFNEIIKLSYEQLKPNTLAQYLLDLAKAFNGFYYEHRILEGDEAVQKSRVALTDATRVALNRGLTLLGIRAPEAM